MFRVDEMLTFPNGNSLFRSLDVPVSMQWAKTE